MKLDKKMMLSLLKEEYDKRISYYLGEIDLKAKHSQSDSELVDDAVGLKLRDRAGFLFTVKKIEQDESGKMCAYLLPPGSGDEDLSKSSKRNLQDQRWDDEYSRADDYSDEDDYYEEPQDEMYHSGIVESEEEDTSVKKSKNKEMKSRKEEERGDILDPDPRAQKRKSFKSSMSSKREYEEVDGMVKVTLDQLEKDFSL
jgi:hypothetical protein